MTKLLDCLLNPEEIVRVKGKISEIDLLKGEPGIYSFKNCPRR